jgi:hypothetical protein
MRQEKRVSRIAFPTSFIAFALFSIFAVWMPNAASATPANGADVARLKAQFSLISKAAVVCARVKEGNNVRTWSCPDGNNCVNVAGSWKCRPNAPRPELMACSVCYNNQKRDSNACTSSGNLPSQAACVNRVNSELMKCLGRCK